MSDLEKIMEGYCSCCDQKSTFDYHDSWKLPEELSNGMFPQTFDTYTCRGCHATLSDATILLYTEIREEEDQQIMKLVRRK